MGERKKSNFWRKHFKTIVKAAAIVLIAVAFWVIGKTDFPSKTDADLVKLKLEDIGELATQSAYCTEVAVIEDPREMLGIKIPFTQSKYIYSYDIRIKAGYNFEDIKWKEKNKTIEIKLPEAKILSSELDTESLKVYHEDESIFSQITLKENNEAMKKMQENAEKNAEKNGLLDEACNNAEVLLKDFFAKEYDLNEYKIVFK